jgi:hypothetical protein
MSSDDDQLSLFDSPRDWDHVRRELPEPPAPPAPEPDPYALKQPNLIAVPQNWEAHWKGMPDYTQENQTPWQTLKVHFRNADDRKAFADLIGQQILDRTSFVWHPKAERGVAGDKRWVTEEKVMPRQPVYIISKGRWETRQTSKALELIGIPYRIVVEPQEYLDYARVIDSKKISFAELLKMIRSELWQHASTNTIAFMSTTTFPCPGSTTTKSMKTGLETGRSRFADRYENCGPE